MRPANLYITNELCGAQFTRLNWTEAFPYTLSRRQTLGNGTLYFPPFRAEDYRADVHSTVYRCKASNLGGAILSRDVKVRAVNVKLLPLVRVNIKKGWEVISSVRKILPDPSTATKLEQSNTALNGL
ncbi:hypothetical protein C0J52_22439 [Blattella germanica]|nr:hypothetical protein C0J52_22439 [Blattella germanica]